MTESNDEQNQMYKIQGIYYLNIQKNKSRLNFLGDFKIMDSQENITFLTSILVNCLENVNDININFHKIQEKTRMFPLSAR